MGGRPIILLEFNELCPELLAEWMEQGLLPNFKRFYDASQVFTGVADVTEQVHLEPWIQWYSLHTGFSYHQHGVFHLTDGLRRGLKDVWRILLESGYRVGNCAGMNAPGFEAPGSFYLPDAWCNSQAPYPPELQAYQRFVLANVQEHTNDKVPLDLRAYLDFFRFWTSHGLSANSVGPIARQLLRERMEPESSWRRAVLLDKIQFDVFSHYWRKTRPDFASFFINSTAHFQHSYFHLLRPESFDGLPVNHGDVARKDAVLFGYQEMDKLLAQFFELEKRGAMLVFSTALSQRPNPEAGALFYRPRDAGALLRELGVEPTRLLPVMTHQYSAEFADQASADQARERLKVLRHRGRPLFDLSDAQPKTIFFGIGLHAKVPPKGTVEFEGKGRSAAFYDLFYRIPETKSGVHQSESALWFKTGAFATHAAPVSILDVLPTLLEYYGVEAPEEEGMARPGRSFLPALGIGTYAGRPKRPPSGGVAPVANDADAPRRERETVGSAR